jgi:ubiquinone/menaquinone biosynthesis C-methylase UbiE
VCKNLSENEVKGDFRRRYAEKKLEEEARRSGTAILECDQLLLRLSRLEGGKLGNRILDLGCGTGRLTIPIAEKGYEVHGTDTNSDIIDIARSRAQKRNLSVGLTVARAEHLPFGDGVFDVCIADSVLEHVADWESTLAEVARVLKKGGVAYFDAANALCPFPTEVKYIPFYGLVPAKMRRWITDVIVARFPNLVEYSSTPAQHWFTPTGLRKALYRAGFKRSWDLFDITTKDEIPPRYGFARFLLPLFKRIPPLYFRDIAHVPLSAVRLFCQKS